MSLTTSDDSKTNNQDSNVLSWTHLPIDIEQKILDLTGPIQLKAYSLREDPVDWLPYAEEDIISHDDYSFIDSFQSAQSKEERDSLLEYFQDKAFATFKKAVQKISNVEDMQKLLVLIDDMIWEDGSRTKGFQLEDSEPWDVFMPLLDWEDEFVRNIGSRLISILIVDSPVKPQKETLDAYLNWLKAELTAQNPYLQSVARCLQKMLRLDDYRKAFMVLSGTNKIVKTLSKRLKPQAQYQFTFCLWISSFTPQVAERLNRAGTIPVLAEVLYGCPTEVLKIPRIIVATFRNLLEKPREPGVRKHNALVMIQCKVMNYLASVQKKIEDFNDPEYAEDFEVIHDILKSYLRELSSFEEYSMEVKSHRLEWSMVHTSRKFWLKNAERLNENKYELLKILISLLESSKDNVVLCIAAHDLAEYIKRYSRGKTIIEDLGGKDAILRLLEHKHPSVKYYALKTLQVLMLNNYELFSYYQSIAKNLIEEESEETDLGTSWRH